MKYDQIQKDCKDILFICDRKKNIHCEKNECYIVNGACYCTTKPELKANGLKKLLVLLIINFKNVQHALTKRRN